MKQALELIGRAEGAAEALASSQANAQAPAAATGSMEPHTDATPTPDVTHALSSAPLEHLLRVSQELQQQQKQMQQQMAELKQLQADAHHAAADTLTLPVEPQVNAIKTTSEESATPLDVQSSSPAPHHAKASMSLAAEVAQESKLEASESEESEEKAPELPRVGKSKRHHTLEPRDSHEEQTRAPKAHSEVEDIPRMQAPKDFPAALRGGWQGLLAKKRAETKKKPSKPDDSLGIMELMQTPKTYTAWLGAPG